MKLTVVGLGARKDDITLRGAKAVATADLVILKTELAACSGYILDNGIPHVSLDFAYERAVDFDKLNKRLAREVLKLAKQHHNTVYCVPNSGSADNSVAELLSHTKNLEIIPSVGKCEDVLAVTLPACSYTAYSQYDLPDVKLFKADKTKPLVVYDIDSRQAASAVKLLLTRCYGDEAAAYFTHAGCVDEVALYEIDRRQAYDYSTAIVVKPCALLERKAFDYSDLVEIMEKLRGENGCPWDRAQTHESIKSNLIEEAYELVEAIELADPDKMCEETGDCLLQTVFHAEMGEEAGEFTSTDMFNELCNKLIFRHSHIFGSDHAENAANALDTWERNKRIEKKQETVYDAMASVPKQFPALLRAYKVLKKAHKAGKSQCFNMESADLTDQLMAVVERFVERGEEPELALKSRTDAFVEQFHG